MPRIIGIITAWGTQDLIEPAIKQGLKLCDELHVCVSAHSNNMLKFEDNTYNIAKKYKDEIILLDYNNRDFHATTKANILNTCLQNSKMFDVGNWIWVLDVDEFYDTKSITDSKIIMLKDYCDMISFTARYFFIDTKHYLLSDHNRLFRIKDKSNRFFPTQQWPYVSRFIKVFGMFHYGTMTNPHMKLEFWKTEYPGKSQNHKVEWIDKIYRNYDLNDEDYWIKKNYELTECAGPWICDAFKSDNGKLFKYHSRHPKVIEESGLTKIKDFRRYYEF